MPSYLHHPGRPATHHGVKRPNQIKPAKGSFTPSFCLFSLYFVPSGEMESLSMKQLYICGERNVLKTHAKNSLSITFGESKGWWKYTKNLTFVFELLFKIFICAGKPIELEVSIHYNNKWYFKSNITMSPFTQNKETLIYPVTSGLVLHYITRSVWG